MDDRQETARQRADRLVQEAEQRRDEQARIVAGLAHHPEAQFLATRVLKEVESTLQLTRLCQSFLEIAEQ